MSLEDEQEEIARDVSEVPLSRWLIIAVRRLWALIKRRKQPQG